MSVAQREAIGSAANVDVSRLAADRMLSPGAGMVGGSYMGGVAIGNEGSVGSVGGPALGAAGNPLQSSPYLSQSHPTSATAVIPPPHASHSLGPLVMSGTASLPAAQDPRLSVESHSGSPYQSLVPASTSQPSAAATDAIMVAGLPKDVTVDKLAKYFGEFGQLKMDRSKDPPAPLIQIIRNPHYGAPTCEAKIMWDNPDHAPLAVSYFNGKHWPGVGPIRVELAIAKPPTYPPQQMAMPQLQQPQMAQFPGAAAAMNPLAGYPPQGYLQPPYDPRMLAQMPIQQAALQGMAGAPSGQTSFPPQAFDPRQVAAYPQQTDPYGMGAAGGAGGMYTPYATPSYASQLPTMPSASPGAPMAQQPMYLPQAPYGYPPGAMPNQPMQPMYPMPDDPSAAYGAPLPLLQHSVPTGPPRVFKGKGGAARAGDWICPSCGNNNFAWRATCKQCTVPRPPNAQVIDTDEEQQGNQYSGGGGPSGGGRGGHRPGRAHNGHPDDWICPRCNFKNFSKRDTCHDCRLPRPQFASHGPVRGGGQQEFRRERSNRPY